MHIVSEAVIFPITTALPFRSHMLTTLVMLVILLQPWIHSCGTVLGVCRGLQHFEATDPACHNIWNFLMRLHRPLALLQWLVRDALFGRAPPVWLSIGARRVENTLPAQDQQCAIADPVHTCYVSLSAVQLATCAVVSTALYYREYVARMAWLQYHVAEGSAQCDQVAKDRKQMYVWTLAMGVLILCTAARAVVMLGPVQRVV